MTEVIMYTTNICPYCVRAKQLLNSKGVTYTEINLNQNPDKRAEMMEITGRRSVPQIIINGEAVGGFDDIAALNKQGELDKLLNL